MAKDSNTKRGFRKLIPWLVVGALVALIVVGLIPKPVQVETATIGKGPLVVSVFEEGKTRIRHRYNISPPVAGYLNRVELRAGAPIKAGETVLATIKAELPSFLDPRAKAQAEARLSGARAAREQRQAELERAKAALDLGRKDLERSDSLLKSGAISRQEWDQAKNRVEVLEREERAAQFAMRVGEFEIEQAQAALLQAENGGQSTAEPVLVKAPVDGFVLNVYEESARVIAPGTNIMEVGDLRDIEAEIELLSSDAVGVRPGAEVSIEEWGGPRPLKGRVALVEPGGFTKVSALGVEEQRVRVRVDFTEPLPEGTMLGDRYRVEARIVTWSGENVLRIPTGAMFRRGGDWMAFVARDGVAEERKLGIGHNNGIVAEVLEGLAEGDQVILHPPDTVAAGKKIVVKGE
jgi:HlyD family secretion protein